MYNRISKILSVIFLGSMLLASSEGVTKKTINNDNVLSIENNVDLKQIESIGVSARNSIINKLDESLIVKQGGLNKIFKDINYLSVYNEIRSVGEYNENINRDCTDCEFDFTPYGSECCDSAWDEFGIDCMTLEANYNWDCSGCLCPGDGEAVCGDGFCSGDETYETCPSDCNAPGECDAGQILDCDGSDECWPESWIGDGFADCQDQAYGADLTCYDCDGGDCPESDPGCGGTAECGDGYCNGDETEASCPEDCAGGGTTGGSGDCEDCEFDFTPYGSECCDTAWDEFGINCADLEANYSWDCSGCSCPGDTGGDTGGTTGGDCDAGYVQDCVDADCCPESWIGDGFEDCEDQAFGCDLTCYDNDGGDCEGGTDGGTTGGDCSAGYVEDCADADCCPESWIGDGLGDCEDQAWGCDLTCYDNDGGDCEGGTTGGTTGGSESCDDCEFDWTPYGSECCDTAWDEYGIDCATLEGAYGWDCSGCSCPGDNGGTDGGTDGGDCGAGYVDDCSGDGDCCPESWIGDGFADCEDQAWGCDLTCYDNDGGDCEGGGTDGGTDGGSENCEDCLYDFTPYGSECCDTAWDEYGIDCATLESGYNWDCSGCSCPGDGDPVCGDGSCNGDETYDTCPEDCNEPGTCDTGQVVDCDGSGECWPESWIGDGFADCNDQAYGADLTCYDCDGGDCPDSDPGCGDPGDTYGCTDSEACNYDSDATMDDGSCAENDECGECGGDGPMEMCSDGSYVCDASDCPPEDPDVYIIAGDATVSGGMAYVSLSYESTQEVAGIQFTISDEPDVATAVAFDADDDVFMASSNDSGGDVTAVFFSISGAALPATDETTQFAVLTYELSAELSAGDVVELHFTDVVCSSTAGTSIPAMGVDGSISSGSMPGDVNGDGLINVQDIILVVNLILDGGFSAAADVNGDGLINVQDIILIVNMILDSRASDASSAEILMTPHSLKLQADGFIGAVQMTLNHGNNFSIDLTDKAMVSEYRTSGNHTTLIVVVPEGEELFTYSGEFEIADIMVVNGSDEIDVVTPAVFTLGAAYPNPFNPSTSIALDVSDAGNVNVAVYNLMGQAVSTLAAGYMNAGSYTLTWDASNQVSGMYLVRAETAGFVSTQKLLLIK